MQRRNENDGRMSFSLALFGDIRILLGLRALLDVRVRNNESLDIECARTFCRENLLSRQEDCPIVAAFRAPRYS